MPPLQAKGRSTPARSAASRMASPSATGTSRRLPSMIRDANAFGGADGGDHGFRSRLAAEAGDEAFDMNALGGDADVAAGRLDLIAHSGRAADEDVVDALRRHQ